MKKLISVITGLAFALLSVPTSAAAQWRYQTDTDKMTGKESQSASIESVNSLSLDSPYRGRNHGNLIVRQHPKYGLDVIFTIDKGQLLCRSYDDSCSVMIRFDDAKPTRFAGAPSGDLRSTAIFLRDAPRFIVGAEKAKRILVQAPVYQNGEPIFEFPAALPLQWAKPKKRKSTEPATQWPVPPAELSPAK